MRNDHFAALWFGVMTSLCTWMFVELDLDAMLADVPSNADSCGFLRNQRKFVQDLTPEDSRNEMVDALLSWRSLTLVVRPSILCLHASILHNLTQPHTSTDSSVWVCMRFKAGWRVDFATHGACSTDSAKLDIPNLARKHETSDPLAFLRPPCISDALASHIEDPWSQEWFLVVGDFFVFVHCKQECWSWTQM